MKRNNLTLLFFCAFVVSLCICSNAFSQGAESITLTTYYPSPYGEYQRLRLFPSSQPTCDANNIGLMYYDSATNRIRYCDGSLVPPDWTDVGGGPWAWEDANNKVYLRDNNDRVGIGTTSPNNTIQVTNLINFDNVRHSTNLGYQAGNSNSGNDNTFMGYQAGYSNTTGYYNTALGPYALYSNTTGYRNIALGNFALFSNTTGYTNIALGPYALFSNTTGYGANIALGPNALYFNTTGNFNTALGPDALYFNTTGTSNTALGIYALFSNTTGYYNSALGPFALYFNTTGNNNTALGPYAFYSNTTGNYNTTLGTFALYSNTTGNNNTALGSYADVASNNLSNATAIGYRASVDLSNKVRIGNANVTIIEGEVDWSIPSDSRGKYDVKDYTHGLDLVLKLRPVEFKLKDDATKKMHSGFIAQEVEAIGVPFYGLNKPETDKGSYSLQYSGFVVPLVKSVQEQQKQIESLKAEIKDLKSRLNLGP